MTDAPLALSAINAAGTALALIGLAVSLDPEELVRGGRALRHRHHGGRRP